MSAEKRPSINLGEPEDPGYELTPEIAEILDAAGQDPINLVVCLKKTHQPNLYDGMNKEAIYPEVVRAFRLNSAGLRKDIGSAKKHGEKIIAVPIFGGNSISLLA